VKNVLRSIARRQHGVVAVWQLRAGGMSASAVRHGVAGLRSLHHGVYVTGDAPVTRVQRWWAATLTAPGTVLSFASAAAAWEIRPWDGGFEVVTRPGSGGPKRHGDLLVCRARRIDATTLHGFAVTTPEQTIADLWRRLPGDRARRKLLREALRLQRCTVATLRAELDGTGPRNRPASLRSVLDRYERLGLQRCRSDAEAIALELLDEAGLPVPDVNEPVAGIEADLSWPDHRLVVELDGDRFHRDKAEDARKTRTWHGAGWRVRRVDTDVVFDEPASFVARVREWFASY
jgi:hypothetical protein